MKIVFMGTPDFAETVVDEVYKAGHEIVLCVCQPDKPVGRSGKLSAPPVKRWALEHNIPVFQPERIKRPEAVEELRKYDAQMFLVAAFGQILSKEILDMPKFGCVNVHASLLPKYRGAAPIQWAVIDGEEYSGVTTMQMGVGLDDGDMLLKEEVKLEPDETGGSLFDKLAVVGGQLAVKTILAAEKGELCPVPQDESKATHVGMISKSLGNIDFNKSAVEIERLIRGLNPWPSAFTYLDGKLLKFYKAAVVEIEGCAEIEGGDKTPGTVIKCDGKELIVACGKGTALSILNLQIEGKKAMDIEDFLRGRSVAIGTRLGNN